MTHVYAKPTRTARLSDEAFRYEFADSGRCASGTYRPFGGLAWPDPSALATGAALALAYEPKAGMAHVLAEHEFSVVDPLIADGAIDSVPDLASFLASTRADYQLDEYFWHGSKLDWPIWQRAIFASARIAPKPALAQADWLDEAGAMAVITLWDEGGRIRYLSDGPVNAGITQFRAERIVGPALWALASALSGLEMWGGDRPIKKRKEPDLSWKGLV